MNARRLICLPLLLAVAIFAIVLTRSAWASAQSLAPRATEPAYSPPGEGPTARALAVYVESARAQRLAESGVGLAASGALFGLGFATEGPDMTLSHWLWGSSAIVAAGSLINFAVRSDLERLSRQGQSLEDAELRRRWRELAVRMRKERKFGSVLGGLLAATSAVFGGLVLAEEIGSFDEDDRLILGTTLLTGGALGVSDSVVQWFVPTPAERGYLSLEASQRPTVSLQAVPLAGGGFVGVRGAF